MAMIAMAMGAACDEGPHADAELELDDVRGERPQAPSDSLTTHGYAEVVPGFELEIALGGQTGEDVVLEWPTDDGVVTVYRSTNPHALLDLDLGQPLPEDVDAFSPEEPISYIDFGAASQQTETPSYYYRVGRSVGGNQNQGEEVSLSTMVMKTTTAMYTGYTKLGLCMLDGPQSASDLHATLGDPSITAVWGWNAYDQSYMGWFAGGGGVDFPLDYGNAVVVQRSGTGAQFHSLVGTVPTNEPLMVSGQPGLNWTTVPVFYKGPKDASYWVDDVGYWGVGRWDSATQGANWYWGPGYADMELEACGTYYVQLPDNACTSNDDCDPDKFCHFVEAAACGDVAAGLCLPLPLDCNNPKPGEVCGCDGNTYETEHAAHLARVSVAHGGECPPPPPPPPEDPPPPEEPPPPEAPPANACPDACLGLPAFQALVVDPMPISVPDWCWLDDWDTDGSAQLNAGWDYVSVWWDGDAEIGECSGSVGWVEVSVEVTDVEAKACADLVKDRTELLGLACNIDW
ncbi:hypothetical protein [Paraliomyxa miuraensis]|uniref:hypothetical protein n=1 Tax=Paraliomyxa miuraensis TaxID=376150 RepID=UPI0022587C85|nr:hypothetical protein [Paraliomyxa miuraensis]